MSGLLHLVRRFFASLVPGPPSEADSDWAASCLGPGELVLWERMRNPDKRHAVGVARLVAIQLGTTATRPVLAAALMHDVGKIESDLRTPARCVATVVWAVAPEDRMTKWQSGGHLIKRLAQYRNHPELGETLLQKAGSDSLTCDWAGDHHLGEPMWRVPTELGRVLKECDDD